MSTRPATRRSVQRKLPPYARELTARLRAPASFKNYAGTSADGKAPTIWIACGPGAWDWVRRNQGKRIVTLAPPGEDPTVYDWRALRDHDPVFVVALGKISQDEIRTLIAAIMRDGVKRAVVGANNSVTVYRRKEATHGTA